MEKANLTTPASEEISEEWLQSQGFIPHEDGTSILELPMVTDIATQPVNIVCYVSPEDGDFVVWLEQPPEEDGDEESAVFLNCLPKKATRSQLLRLISALSPNGTNASNNIDNA